MKKIVILLLITAVLALGVYTSWRSRNGSTDFDAYYYAAKRIVMHEPIYSDRPGVAPYIYPPLFACLMTPLTFFSIGIASFIWYLASVAMFALSLILCSRMIFPYRSIREIYEDSPLMPGIVFIAVTSGVFIDCISLLQADILILFSVVSGLYLFVRGRKTLGAAFLAMAISIKMIPALFLVYFIIKRQFKFALAMIVFLLLFTLALPSMVIGVKATRQGLARWNDTMLMRFTSSSASNVMMGPMFNPVNQSVTASVSRWLVKNDDDLSAWKTRFFKYPALFRDMGGPLTRRAALNLARAMVYLAVGVSLLVCIFGSAGAGNKARNYEFSIIFIASLLSNPLLRTSHLAFLIFPALFLLSQISRQGRFFYCVFILAGISYLLVADKGFRIMGSGTMSLFLFWILLVSSRKKLNL